MRLRPGVTLERADIVLREAYAAWLNARNETTHRRYMDAVHSTYSILEQTFAAPDVTTALRSAAYWNFLSVGVATSNHAAFTTDPDIAHGWQAASRTMSQALATEMDSQLQFIQWLQSELRALVELTGTPGLPIVYDTNMLNHWSAPSDIDWTQLLKDRGETLGLARLVVPLQVIDELDRQKYGNGTLAQRAATAIRYLERSLEGSSPGRPIEIRRGASLEIWTAGEERGRDVDLVILQCAADLANMHAKSGARVLTGDYGMRLRAQQMGLEVLQLPAKYRKPEGSK